ncbi:MAG: hypothetical protein U0Q12_01350 [Vicinamibacterales bacterium]
MSHLTPADWTDWLDGRMDGDRRSHLETCERCGRIAADLRVASDGAALAAEVPEPSPLFWEHLARRVGDAVAAEPLPASGSTWWSWRFSLAAAATVTMTLAGVSTIAPRSAGSTSGDETVASLARVDPAPTLTANPLDMWPGSAAPVDDAGGASTMAWELMVSVAASADWSGVDHASATSDPVGSAAEDLSAENRLGVEVDSLDAAVEHLTDDERAELVRFLERAVRGASAPGS